MLSMYALLITIFCVLVVLVLVCVYLECDYEINNMAELARSNPNNNLNPIHDRSVSAII